MWKFLSLPSAETKADWFPDQAVAPVRFDLTDLRLFVQVAETSSITHGADQANMALASASARIRGMEETLGVPLLKRGPRGVKPTPAGRALVHHAHVVLQQLERMRGELGKYAHGLKGHVRLLSNTIAPTEFLPQALAAFLTGHPSVDIDLEERPSHEIVQAVAEGFADAGIVIDMVDLAELETFPFVTDRLVLIAPRDHPLSGRRQLAFREVLDHEFVGLSREPPAGLYWPASSAGRSTPQAASAPEWVRRNMSDGRTRCGHRSDSRNGRTLSSKVSNRGRSPDGCMGGAKADNLRSPV